MRIYVESPEELGSVAFKALIEDVISDLKISRLIEEVRVCIDTERPLFYISVKRVPHVESISIDDFLEMKEDEVLRIEVKDERYAPHLLRMLWEKFGENGVNQIRRNILEVNAKKEEIRSLPMYKIREGEMEDVIHDLIHRITPIGFRVTRRMDSGNNTYAYVSSENPITDGDLEELERILSLPAKEISMGMEDLMPEPSDELREETSRRIGKH